MDSTGYITLTRQMGLEREMQIIANNIANAATTGFRQEGLIFSEYVKDIEGAPSLSMGQGNVQNTAFDQGMLSQTAGNFDFAIEGEGFFLVETPAGVRLTRSGAFSPNAQGDLVTHDGYPVLDAGGAPLFVPPGADISAARDGTLSADGNIIGQIGVVTAINPASMQREDGVMFRADAGYVPVASPNVMQGFREASNVNAIGQLARMVEVQRAYEMGASFLEAEDKRVRQAVDTLMK